MDDKLGREIDAYVRDHWDDVVADIEALVSIASVEDLDGAVANAPYGPGPRAALDRVLAIAQGMGLSVHDCDGYIGYADLPGATDTQLGIIGHVDVVAAGPGWTVDPFAVTRKEGYLLGRGVIDDKGPLMVALHAVKFWADRLKAGEGVDELAGISCSQVDAGAAGEHDGAAGSSARFPYTIRVLFGVNEETDMKDVAYYRSHFDDPAFLFTPDAEFPVCYGEAGICNGMMESAPIRDGALEAIEGGQAVNAVPGQARAVVRLAEGAGLLKPTERVSVEQADGRATLTALGKSAHASTPELGLNAIDVLAEYLLANDLVSSDERAFLQLVRTVCAHSDGSGLGVQASDEHFGDLTSVGGVITVDGGRMRLSIDFRYPTNTTSTEIERRVQDVAASAGATFTMLHDKTPFLMDPNSPTVQAMLAAYNDATGEQAKPFTMKGGTYARVFTRGVSFGVDKPWVENPDWVGTMHGPDEGVSEDLLKQSFGIFVRTIARLMQQEL